MTSHADVSHYFSLAEAAIACGTTGEALLNVATAMKEMNDEYNEKAKHCRMHCAAPKAKAKARGKAKAKAHDHDEAS